MKNIFLDLITAINPSSKVVFGQNAEDLMIRNLVNKKKGFYVDVGANHPFRFSNTYYLYLQGWHGINIEPNPELIALFDRYRKRDLNLCLGVDQRQSKLDYYQFNDPALNTFSKKRADQIIQETDYQQTSLKKIEVKPLSIILDQYLSAGQTIDFLSIDVETFDFKVLKSNNWQKYKPNYIIVEELENSTQIEDYLKTKSYVKIASMFKSNFFKLHD